MYLYLGKLATLPVFVVINEELLIIIIFAFTEKKGNLFNLKCTRCVHKVNAVCNSVSSESDGNIWHRMYSPLGVDNLNILVHDCLNVDVSKELKFCEPCVEEKSKSPFPSSKPISNREPLELFHSGKIREKTLSNAEYLVTFIEDATRYV